MHGYLSDEQNPEIVTSIDDDYTFDKEILKEKFKIAKIVCNRVDKFARLMDGCYLESIVGIIPAVGDFTIFFVCCCYYLIEGINIGFDVSDYLKILSFQFFDLLIGLFHLFGDIGDFIFKSNYRCANLFKQKLYFFESQLKKMDT